MDKIRAIHERRPDSENVHGRIMVYQIGSVYKVGEDADRKPIKRKITDIILQDNHYKIYITSEDSETMLWKAVGNTEFVSVEYVID